MGPGCMPVMLYGILLWLGLAVLIWLWLWMEAS